MSLTIWTMSMWFGSGLITLHLMRWLRNKMRRHVTWWELHPDGSEVKWSNFKHVFGGARRKRWSGAILIARFGDFESGTRVFAGSAGIRNSKAAIEQLARAAGAQVGEKRVPPWPKKGGPQWRLGITEPKPREADASAARERQLDEQLAPEQPTFPDAVDDYFTTREDAFVVVCKPARKPTRIHAMAATTVRALDTDITDAAEVRRRLVLPGLTAVLALLLTGGYGGLLWWEEHLNGLAGMSMLAVAVVWLMKFSWDAVRMPPLLRSLRTERLPMFTRSARRGAVLPVWQMGQWAAGTDRAQVQAPRKHAPPEAIVASGAYLGKDPRGMDCYLSYDYRYRGIIAYGDPGTGKSNLLRVLLAADSQQRATGTHMTIVWIESKSKRGGAVPAAQTMEACGLKPLLLSGSSVAGPRLALIDTADPESAGRRLTEAIRFAYDKHDIMEQSAEIMEAVFRAAAAFTPEDCAAVGLPKAPPNLIVIAAALLGGLGDTTIEQKARTVAHKNLPAQHYQPLQRYLQMSKSNKRDYEFRVEPVRNKLKGLLAAAGLFETVDEHGQARPEITFRQLLDMAYPTVLDLAPPEEDSEYTKITASRVSSMAMFMLWDTVRRACDDWQAQGKFTAIYSDELRNIAGLGDERLEVVQEIADQGRSLGVLPVFGTQRPNNPELREGTRSAVNSFGSQFYFALRETTAAEEASHNLSGEYLPAQIRALPVFHCAASVTHRGSPSAAYMLNPPDSTKLLTASNPEPAHAAQ